MPDTNQTMLARHVNGVTIGVIINGSYLLYSMIKKNML